MINFYDAFISYGRADSQVFARNLQQRLIKEGYRVWFDFNDIPLGVDFQHEIHDGIDKAHNFLFIIAPHSVNSIYCAREINWALARQKRIIPLLHVEQIDRTTWQQHNPTGTDADWADYQAKGLHSSFDNMHPAIRKINWVYFREGQDDFEQSFQGVVEIFGRHQDYVQCHTWILEKALAWERQHRRSSCLLIGEERQQAEAWLKTRFKQEQPPCVPSDLHCEFITESTKNANNLMTQVFLVSADSAAEVKENIRRSLLRESFTVWTNKTDITTGVDFQNAIKKGIEEADNVVVLLSPDALASDDCRQELTYALSLNKRIIPLLVKDVAQESMKDMPSPLLQLQFINLTQHHDLTAYHKDMAKLVRVLRQDATYYEQHKTLLVKALKWERQNHNPSLLLRGYTLNHAATWLKTAKGRSHHPPTEIQERFITASLQHPKELSLDVFVSYSRTDSDFARRLNDALQSQGKTTWFDQESIASGADFQRAIYEGIEQCNNFVMILSPQSVTSPYCADEVGYAAKLNKRCVTILYRAIDANTLPPELATIQWIDFNQHGGDFYTNFSELIRTLDLDREHVHNHTRWLQRSLEWDAKDRNPDLLLRGSEFAVADMWLNESQEQNKHPPATDVQRAFIEASHAAITAEHQQEKRQTFVLRSLLGLVSVIALVAIGTSAWAIQSRRRAIAEEVEAYIATSKAHLALNQRLEALLTSLKAAHIVQISPWLQNDVDLTQRVTGSLQEAVYWTHNRNRLGGHTGEPANIHNGSVEAVIMSPDGQHMISADETGAMHLWHRDGTLLKTMEADGGGIWRLHYSPTGKQFAAAHEDGSISLWNADGDFLSRIQSHVEKANAVAFSPNGEMLLSASADGTVKVWGIDDIIANADTIIPRHTIADHDDEVTAIALNPTGDRLVSTTGDGTLRLWQLSLDGRGSTLLHTIPGHDAAISDVAFSPNGQMFATSSYDATVKLWWSDGTPYGILDSETEVASIQFSPDGQLIAGGHYKTIRLWNINGIVVDDLPVHTDWLTALTFSADQALLVSASIDHTVELLDVANPLVSQWQSFQLEFGSSDAQELIITHDIDGHVRRWNADGTLVSTLPLQANEVTQVALSHAGDVWVTASEDGLVQIWNPDGTLANTIVPAANDDVEVMLSPDGQTLVTAGAAGPLQLWKTDGSLIATLADSGSNGVAYAMSANGKVIATTQGHGRLHLWNADGTLLRTLIDVDGAGDRIETLVFVGDSTLIIGYAGGLVERWNIQEPEGHVLLDDDWVSIQPSPDGQTVAIERMGKIIELWSINGTQLGTIRTGHHRGISEILFHPTDDMIVTASDDSTTKLWHLDGSPIASFQDHEKQSIIDIAFSPDGQILATTHKRGRLTLRTLDGFHNLDILIRKGCQQIDEFRRTNPDIYQNYRRPCDGIDLLPRSEWPTVPRFTVPLPDYGTTLPMIQATQDRNN